MLRFLEFLTQKNPYFLKSVLLIMYIFLATVVYSLVKMTAENSQDTSSRRQDGASNTSSPATTSPGNNQAISVNKLYGNIWRKANSNLEIDVIYIFIIPSI